MISIDKDVLIYDILDKLSIRELLNLFATNKELKNKYLPYFKEKIEDYQEDLRYRKEIAIPKHRQNFEKLEQIAKGIKQEPLIYLSDDLSSFMGLSYLPEYGNLKIYNERLLQLWWQIYISQLLGHLVTINEVFRLDDEMADLIQIPRGTNLSLFDFLEELRDFYDFIPIARASDEPGLRKIPQQYIEALANEYRELLNILIFISQQNVRQNTYPTIMTNPPTYEVLA